jgi:hypothetical protein
VTNQGAFAMSRFNPFRYFNVVEMLIISMFAMLAAFSTPALSQRAATATMTVEQVQAAVEKSIGNLQVALAQNGEPNAVLIDLEENDEVGAFVEVRMPASGRRCLVQLHMTQELSRVIGCEHTEAEPERAPPAKAPGAAPTDTKT